MNQFPLFELFLLSRSAFNERRSFNWYKVRSVIHALLHDGSDDSDFFDFKTSMTDLELCYSYRSWFSRLFAETGDHGYIGVQI